MKLLFLGFSFLFLVSCEDNSRADCAAVSCAAQSLSIELINADGTNLITNETYSLDNIIVLKENTQVNEFPSEIGERIIILISGTEGDNTYEISLNDSETDSLLLNLTKISPGSECCGPLFQINNAVYNETSVEIIRATSEIEKIVVIK